jgi:hypothetical protein
VLIATLCCWRSQPGRTLSSLAVAALDVFGVKAKDVKMTEYPDTWHAYDFPTFPATPTVAKDAQTTLRCTLREESVGIMVNVETQKPFT